LIDIHKLRNINSMSTQTESRNKMVDRPTNETTRKQAILGGTPYIVTKQFPWKLHEMLDLVEKGGEESIVSWLPSGRAFKVHLPDLFVEKIMKLSFNQTKYKSFQRQLNLWGFERNTKECVEKGAYCHPLFIRGRRDQCQEMARQKIKFPTTKLKQKKQYESSGIASPSTEHIKQAPQLVQRTPSPLLSNQLCNVPSESATRIQQPVHNSVVINTLRVLNNHRRHGLPPLVAQSHPCFYTRNLMEPFTLQVGDAEIIRAIRSRAALEAALAASLAGAPWDPLRATFL
jgi:hypothetical protein